MCLTSDLLKKEFKTNHMKTTISLFRSIVLALFLFQSAVVLSQSYEDSLKKDDEDIISAIAPYPADVRNAILNVSQYSQKLVKIERIQSRTSQSFQDLVSSYPREDQEKFYELARYPDLIHKLVDGPPQTLEQVKPTLGNYPKATQDAVAGLFPMHLAELTSMDKTYQSSQKGLNDITKSLPDDAQADFKKIVGMPDVMNLLTERIDLAVSLGEAYKSDPNGIRAKLDSLSGEITAQNQKDLDDYKKQVENDPQMQEEMKKSAQDFADSYSSEGESSGSPSDAVINQNQQTQPQVVNNYYYSGNNYDPYPYSYWFGYPYWYSSPMWYPRPLYYYTGFYIGAGGAVVVTGLPSRAYSGWFFNTGYRRYPRFYNYCNTYYTNHRIVVNRMNVYRGFHTSVNQHFARNANVNINRNVNRNINVNRNVDRNVNVNRNTNIQRNANVNRSNNVVRDNTHFRNSINAPSNNVSHREINTFHATQFHQQSWGGMHGGGSVGGGGHVGGGGGGFHGRR